MLASFIEHLNMSKTSEYKATMMAMEDVGEQIFDRPEETINTNGLDALG